MLHELEQRVADGKTDLQLLARGVQIETAIASAEAESDEAGGTLIFDPVFRLRTRRWAMAENDLSGLVPNSRPANESVAVRFRRLQIPRREVCR